MQKVSLFYLFILEMRSRVQRLDWPHPFFIMLNQKISDLLLIFVNLYHHEKNEAVSSICSEEVIDLKILQSDWPILCLFS